jgi:hypothetical protein
MPETGRTAQIQLNGGAAIVSYDPQKWGKLETDKEGIISLDRLVGAGCAAIIAEGIGIPSNVAVEDILEELKKEHSDLQVFSRELRTVNGEEVCCWKYGFRVQELDMIVYAYCHGGLAGTLQVRTCCTVAAFEECEADFTELLNGLEVRPTAHPGLARMRQGMGFAAKVTVLAAPVLGIAWFRFWLRTDWKMALLISAGMAAGLFVFAWGYGLVKYKLR